MPDPAARPRVVEAAYWLWMLAAGLLIVLALLSLTTSSDAVRERFASADAGHVDALVTLLRVSGGVWLFAAVVVGLLAGPVRAGHARLRPVLVGWSVVVAVLLLVQVATGLTTAVLLPVPVLLLIAAVLAYRSSANIWFRP
ncbi:hypothetical protein G4X40_07170 [Rhodococcus sp. D2-41]|uniref:hypothetical protein n=1 Tax=Speluncibacter jeojiensis TaxID=2710754 RepID=UPI00240FAD6F|nr:hypothetical protein [Rhodococcus sp. D2-41]MDG3009925.1 hypothetical protein [Rhodococcus sp. D2-41]